MEKEYINKTNKQTKSAFHPRLRKENRHTGAKKKILSTRRHRDDVTPRTKEMKHKACCRDLCSYYLFTAK